MTTSNTNANTNTINQNVNDTTNTIAPKEFSKWEDLEDFNPELLRGIYAHGFDKPSIIQQKAQTIRFKLFEIGITNGFLRKKGDYYSPFNYNNF